MACLDSDALGVSFFSCDNDIVESLLKSWNMGDYYPALQANDIDLDLLLILDIPALDKILPDVTYGKKLKLLQKIRELKEVEIPSSQTPIGNMVVDINGNCEMTSQACDGSAASEILAETSTVRGAQPVVTEKLPDVSLVPVSKRQRSQDSEGSDFNPELEDEEGSDSDTPLIKVRPKKKKVLSPSSKTSEQSTVCTPPEQIDAASLSKEPSVAAALKQTSSGAVPEKIPDDKQKKTSERLVNPNHLVEKKVAASSYKEALNKLDLKMLLNESLDGKAILNVYAMNELLEDDDRDSLTDIVMKWVLLKNTKPSKDDYVLLREKILTLFPKEINVYYFAPKEEDETQTLARGKLFDRARNVKEWMRKKGLLERVKGKQKSSSADLKQANGSAINVELTAEISDAIKWLKLMRQPWETVEEKWKLTSEYRYSCLLKSRTNITAGRKKGKRAKNTDDPAKAETYIDTYKVLRDRKGYMLIEIDFSVLHGADKANAIALKWPSVRNALVSILKNQSSIVKDPEGKNILKRLLNCNDDDWIDIYVIQLLSSLVPPSRLVEFGKKKFKPTIKDSREALIINVNKDNQVEDFIAGRRSDICTEFGGKAYVQPYILYVASSEQTNAPSCFYVVIDNFSYMCKSVVQALDVCFKVFIAIDMNYPVQCAHIWLLIQQYIYEVFTPDDESINNVKTFILKLKSLSTEP